jgi:hypothetical protein
MKTPFLAFLTTFSCSHSKPFTQQKPRWKMMTTNMTKLIAKKKKNCTLKAMSFTFGTRHIQKNMYKNPVIEMMSFNLFRMKKLPNIKNGKKVNLKFYVTISTLYSK